MKLFISMFIAGVLVFPIYLISRIISATPKKQEKAKQRAIANGHVVTATLKKIHASTMEDPSNPMDRSSLGIYTYEFRGKKYKYRLSSDDPPYRLTLYFVKNPRNAAVEKCMNVSEFPWKTVYLVVSLLIFLLVKA